MLRRVSVEKASVTECYRGIRRVEADLLSDQGQLRGSGNRRPGTREAGSARPAQAAGRSTGVYPEHVVAGEPIRARQLAKLIQKKFDLDVHPRTIERAVAVKKTARLTPRWRREFGAADRPSCRNTKLCAMAALGQALPPEARCGLMLFLRRGMWGWARVMATAGREPVATAAA